MSSLNYAILKKEVPVIKGKTILDHSIKSKIPHLHECGGNGICTTCRVRVIDGPTHLSDRTEKEIELAEERMWDPTLRLACQAKVLGGPVTIERMIWTSAETSNLQLETIPMGMGEEREMAFLFCDMRNFTTIAESQLNFDLAHILNRFFTALGDPVYMNNGVIYQYAGDEIVAIFGAGGGDFTKICLDAIRAALGMLYAIERLNRWELDNFGITMRVGIGIHFGRAFIGNIGHYRHKQFAVIGDPMNVTSRIQTKNKELGTELLISQDTYENIPDGILEIGAKSEVQLKGKEGSFEVFEVRGFAAGGGQLVLQSSLHRILKNEDNFATRFYDHVFEIAPETRSLFSGNLGAQGNMLTHMLRGIIYTLSRPEFLQMGLKALGNQHRDYGVKREHYPVVKQALLQTIAEELGDEYTEEIGRAWDEAISMIVAIMNS